MIRQVLFSSFMRSSWQRGPMFTMGREWAEPNVRLAANAEGENQSPGALIQTWASF
jgi:hypothetical protein